MVPLRRYSDEFDTFVENHPTRKLFYKKMRKEEGFDERETDSALDRLRQTVDKNGKTSRSQWRPMANGRATHAGVDLGATENTATVVAE